MSLKRRIQVRYDNFSRKIKYFVLPSWLSSKTMRAVFSLIILILLPAYIIKIISSSSTGYEINKLENQINSLQADIRKIQIEVADSSSINSIRMKLSKIDMVAASSQIKYLTSKDAIVAKK